jgi:hypothetical protein
MQVISSQPARNCQTASRFDLPLVQDAGQDTLHRQWPAGTGNENIIISLVPRLYCRDRQTQLPPPRPSQSQGPGCPSSHVQVGRLELIATSRCTNHIMVRANRTLPIAKPATK